MIRKNAKEKSTVNEERNHKKMSQSVISGDRKSPLNDLIRQSTMIKKMRKHRDINA